MRDRLAIGALLVAALAGARLAVEPGLLGSPGGEVYGHAWVQWWHARALPAWPDGPGELLVNPVRWPVIDPIPTALAAGVGRLAGTVAGYDAWVLLAVALAFAGGAALARRVGGDPWTGGLALALAPAFAGSLQSGLTEDGALGLVALALARVGRAGWREAVVAGAALGLLAGFGLVLAWEAALGAVILGLVALARERRRWRELALAAGVAGLLALPAALAQGARLAGTGHGFGRRPGGDEPLWRLNPWGGADLLSLVTPGRVDPGDALVRAHPGYLGLGVLLLSAVALADRRLRRASLPWLLVAGAALAIAPGARLRAAGRDLGLPNPVVFLVEHLPGGALLNHHGRLLLLAAVALAALASLGAARVGRRRAALLVAADLLLLSPVPWPWPVASADPPGVLRCGAPPCLADLAPGALLPVPVAGPGVHFQRPLLDQRFHLRPLPISPNRPGIRARTPSERWLAGLALPDPPPPPDRFEAPPGIGVILVREPWVARVEAVLGPPDRRAPDSAAWSVGEGAAARGMLAP